MAKNLLGGMTAKDFSRGEPPPADSWEYAGVGAQPKKKPPVAAKPAQKIPVIVATSETLMVVERKPKKWRYLGIGAAIGAAATYLGIKSRSY